MRKLASPLESEQMEMAIPDVDGNGVALPDVRTGKRPYGRDPEVYRYGADASRF